MNDFNDSGAVEQSRRAVRVDASLQCWSIEPEAVTYQNDAYHTLSLYLKGGEASFRQDKRSLHGGPGRVSLMPQAHRSVWHVARPVTFMHLYFSDALLKRFSVETFDRDARVFEIRDLTYEDDRLLRRYLLRGVAPVRYVSPVSLQEELYDVFHHLVIRYNRCSLVSIEPRGGLSAAQRRHIVDFIIAGSGQKMTLEAMARQLHLSPYHFARLFRASFGIGPGQYLQHVRLERVRQMLAGPASLADISLAAGFSHQSHMTCSFRQCYLITPARYRQHLGQ